MFECGQSTAPASTDPEPVSYLRLMDTRCLTPPPLSWRRASSRHRRCVVVHTLDRSAQVIRAVPCRAATSASPRFCCYTAAPWTVVVGARLQIPGESPQSKRSESVRVRDGRATWSAAAPLRLSVLRTSPLQLWLRVRAVAVMCLIVRGRRCVRSVPTPGAGTRADWASLSVSGRRLWRAPHSLYTAHIVVYGTYRVARLIPYNITLRRPLHTTPCCCPTSHRALQSGSS